MRFRKCRLLSPITILGLLCARRVLVHALWEMAFIACQASPPSTVQRMLKIAGFPVRGLVIDSRVLVYAMRKMGFWKCHALPPNSETGQSIAQRVLVYAMREQCSRKCRALPPATL